MQKEEGKRAFGQYYTAQNPFTGDAFGEWAQAAGLPHQHVLEPFAGRNDLITMLQSAGQCRRFASFDIAPAAAKVKRRNTLANFPKGFDACVTNPPWLARNSATRRGLPYPQTRYDDLYKHCLEKCLDNCPYVAAIIPATFLQSNLFRSRLSDYILLHDKMFTDTDNPVCLALFKESESDDVRIWYDNDFKDNLSKLESAMEKHVSSSEILKMEKRVVFNDENGKLGLVAFDNTRERSIRFCTAEEIAHYPVKTSSRFFARISGDFGDVRHLVSKLNKILEKIRDDTYDVFLTPFKGVRSDGEYRRRISFADVRSLINAA